MKNVLGISASVVRVLIGMLFLFSAVSKFITVDIFEIYVYSFGLFSLNVCFYISRLIISAELIIGAALISHRNPRLTIVSTILFLVCFIVFLAYAQMVGRTDSCHCFGELMPFNPVQSILKNAVLLLLLVYVAKFTPAKWYPKWWLVVLVYLTTTAVLVYYMSSSFHYIDLLALVMMFVMMIVGILASLKFYNRWYVTAVLLLAPIVTTFILTPPDSWFYKSDTEVFDKELFLSQIKGEETQNDNAVVDSVAVEQEDVDCLADIGLDSGRHIVAFLSPSCSVCRLAADKISTIARRSCPDTSQIVYVFPKVANEESYEKFYSNTHTMRFNEKRIDKELFVRITRGAFPLILLVDNGEIQTTYSYRNIEEGRIVDFLLSDKE